MRPLSFCVDCKAPAGSCCECMVSGQSACPCGRSSWLLCLTLPNFMSCAAKVLNQFYGHVCSVPSHFQLLCRAIRSSKFSHSFSPLKASEHRTRESWSKNLTSSCCKEMKVQAGVEEKQRWCFLVTLNVPLRRRDPTQHCQFCEANSELKQIPCVHN